MCDRCKELQRQYTAATERAEKAESQRDRMRGALEAADRRFRDIATRGGGPLWTEAKNAMRGDHNLIHDDICAALKEVGDE